MKCCKTVRAANFPGLGRTMTGHRLPAPRVRRAGTPCVRTVDFGGPRERRSDAYAPASGQSAMQTHSSTPPQGFRIITLLAHCPMALFHGSPGTGAAPRAGRRFGGLCCQYARLDSIAASRPQLIESGPSSHSRASVPSGRAAQTGCVSGAPHLCALRSAQPCPPWPSAGAPSHSTLENPNQRTPSPPHMRPQATRGGGRRTHRAPCYFAPVRCCTASCAASPAQPQQRVRPAPPCP